MLRKSTELGVKGPKTRLITQQLQTNHPPTTFFIPPSPQAHREVVGKKEHFCGGLDLGFSLG